MKTSSFICLLSVMLIASASSFAQQEAGDVELGLMGSYFTTTGNSGYTIGSGNVSATFGKFVSDYVEISVAPTLSISTSTTQTPLITPQYNPITRIYSYSTTYITETNTTTTFGASAYMTLSLLANARTVPYFGAAYFRSDFRNTEDNGSAGINAGMKMFFTRKTAMDFKGNYLFSLNPGQEGGLLLFTIGLNFLL